MRDEQRDGAFRAPEREKKELRHEHSALSSWLQINSRPSVTYCSVDLQSIIHILSLSEWSWDEISGRMRSHIQCCH